MNARSGAPSRLLAALMLSAVAACSPPSLEDTAPRSDLSSAPPAYAPGPETPPAPSETALLGGPGQPQAAPPAPPEFTPFRMAPIANPVAPRPAPVSGRQVRRTITPSAASAGNRADQPAKPATSPTPVEGAAARLGTALSADVSSGSRLSIPDGLQDGHGVVVLTLPDNLAARLKDEAAKLGLDKAATTTKIRATLSAQGYNITPSVAQVAALGAPPLTFSWQVSPNPDADVEELPLRAEIGGELTAAGKVQTFDLATLGAMPAPKSAPPTDAAKPSFKTDGLAMIVPLLLILIALFILGRWAKARQAEKDRRGATLERFHT